MTIFSSLREDPKALIDTNSKQLKLVMTDLFGRQSLRKHGLKCSVTMIRQITDISRAASGYSLELRSSATLLTLKVVAKKHSPYLIESLKPTQRNISLARKQVVALTQL